VRARSLLVSLATTLLDLGIFSLLTLVVAGAGALCIARWCSGIVGAAANFALNRLVAFRSAGRGKTLGQAGRYALTALVSVTLATGSFAFLRAATGLDPRLLHPASLAVVWLAFTFPMLKGFVFRAS
jgi:putative flippase GtrA